jgi:hypothetical protein
MFGTKSCTSEPVVILSEDESQATIDSPESEFSPEDRQSLMLVDYIGMSVDDVIGIWGDDYETSYHYDNEFSKSLYYKDRRIPVSFCFEEGAFLTQKEISGNEKIYKVIFYPSQSTNNTVQVADGLNVMDTFNDLKAREVDMIDNDVDMIRNTIYLVDNMHSSIVNYIWKTEKDFAKPASYGVVYSIALRDARLDNLFSDETVDKSKVRDEIGSESDNELLSLNQFLSVFNDYGYYFPLHGFERLKYKDPTGSSVQQSEKQVIGFLFSQCEKRYVPPATSEAGGTYEVTSTQIDELASELLGISGLSHQTISDGIYTITYYSERGVYSMSALETPEVDMDWAQTNSIIKMNDNQLLVIFDLYDLRGCKAAGLLPENYMSPVRSYTEPFDTEKWRLSQKYAIIEFYNKSYRLIKLGPVEGFREW